MSLEGTGSPAGGGSAVSAQNPSGSSSSSTPAPNPNAPSVIELSDDSLVRLPGQKEPVKYGDHYRNFQSQFTKKAQEAKQLQQRYQEAERQRQEYERRVREYESRNRSQQPNPGNDLRNRLSQLQYLSGEDAAAVVEHLQQTHESAIQQRDAALALMAQQLIKINNVVKQLHSRSAGSDFDGKIARYVKDLGLPEEATELAKEIYLAYEGDDLDSEYPNILRTRWQQIEAAITASQKRKVDEARQRRPFLPGKGGQGSPSKPLEGFSKASAKDIADHLWPGMVDGGIET
jgi:hypothetical protein